MRSRFGAERFDWISRVTRTLLVAKLQRSKAAGVESHVGVDGIGVERLAQHQGSFLVLVAGLGQEADVGRQRHVSGDLFPNELECVGGGPHVLSAAGDCVSLVRGIVINRSGVKNGADVAVAFEKAGRTRALSRDGPEVEANKCGDEEQVRSSHEASPVKPDEQCGIVNGIPQKTPLLAQTAREKWGTRTWIRSTRDPSLRLKTGSARDDATLKEALITTRADQI